MSKKTLAMRVLESRSVEYRIHSYPESERDAVRIATIIGLPPERVFKTIVAVRGSGKPLLAMVPAGCQLGLKQLARGLGEKKVRLASHKQAEAITGLEVGGISALALLNRGFVPILDESAFAHDTICISAGKKGLNLEVDPQGLQKVIRARIFEIRE